MDRLLAVGFSPAGHWLLEGDKIRCELNRHASQRNVLYAFVCDGQVKYVGKTKSTLATRMGGYRAPGKDQPTNLRNNSKIKESLAKNVAVEIFALPDNGLMHYGQFHLNLAAALEDDIIRTIDPEWNGGVVETSGVGAAAKATASATARLATTVGTKVEPGETPGASVEGEQTPPVRGSFMFVLQPTYHKMGFFNVGVKAQAMVGNDGEVIELFLGSRTQPILGSINRRANSNGTPRIMGGTGLRDWFQTHAAVMQEVAVDVMAPTSIRLRAP